MVLAHYIQEIQTLILSFHPLLVIETVEEERVQAICTSHSRYEFGIV